MPSNFITTYPYHEFFLHYAYRRKSTGTDWYKGTFHAHQGLEIMIIHEGKGRFIVDQKSYEVIPGMLCVFQPYQLHHIQLEMTEETPFVRSIIQFEPLLYDAYFEKWPSLFAFYKGLLTSKLQSPCLYNLDEADQFHSVFQIWENRKQTNVEEFSLFLVAFFYQLKSVWERYQRQVEISAIRTPSQVERILAWLEARYTEPLSLNKMAIELHLSPYHISHRFKEWVGMTLSDYLNERRLQESVKLLTTTNHTVAQIGESIGLENCSYFCKIFKKKFGLSPHQYRKKWLYLVESTESNQ
ncbi:AraC family transcriptional regulator [Paenibacillus humicola]|uniref:AraC family transcriptional regulator n=1 Tax=Paenibacillus humicola TaxID=3110540 RepID=UPI00237A8E9D|nr:AraC family transcriptional regulator [Paenibacillus humicola]